MALTKVTYSMIDSAPANVKDFGAVGDGVTNDCDAFKAAIAASTNIYIPQGTYVISPTATSGDYMLYLGTQGAGGNPTSRNGMHIFGDGNKSIIKLGDDVGAAKLLFGGANADVLSDMLFENFAIDLNGANNLQTNFSDPLRYNSAFYLSSKCTNITFRNLDIYNGSGHQWIRVGNDTSAGYGENIRVEDCTFKNYGIGLTGNNLQDVSVLYIQANNIFVNNNLFECDSFVPNLSKGHTACELHGDTSTQVTNNKFVYTQLPVLIASSQKSTTNVIVDNNTMQQCCYIVSLDGGGSYDQKRINITNNIYYSTIMLGSSIVAIGYSGEPAKTRENIVFQGNIVNCSGNTNQYVNVFRFSNSYIRSLLISENDVANMLGTLLYLEGAATPYCDITIQNNRLDSLGATGGSTFPSTPMFVCVAPSSGTVNSVIINNNVLFNAAAKTYGGGIFRFSGTIDNIYVNNTEQSDLSSNPLVVESGLTASYRNYDISGTYTSTVSGFSVAKTADIKYTRVKETVTLSIPSITGTSNSVGFSFSALPSYLHPAIPENGSIYVQDNGGSYVPSFATINPDGTMVFYADANGSSFTSSGTKSSRLITFTYNT